MQSGEANQDSEPNIAVNPANPLQIAASAFTFNPNPSDPNAPIYVSTDGGNTWLLNAIVPSAPSPLFPTGDITLRFGGTSGELYAGILRDPTFHLEILRSDNFLAPTPMTVLVDRTGPSLDSPDQPYTQATTVTGGADAGKDRVYIGNNDLGLAPGKTATIDQSLDARTAPPPAGFHPVVIEARSTGPAGVDGPQVRPAIHADGTIYALFYHWTNFDFNTSLATADVVLVRDDNWGSGNSPYTALTDPLDLIAGNRVVSNITLPFLNANLPDFGQDRIGGDLAIAIDPNNSSTVYIVWADGTGTSDYTLHVRRSTDRGVTWPPRDLETVTRAKNPGLAINSDGVVGFSYQQITSGGAWVTTLEVTSDGFATPPHASGLDGTGGLIVLANTPANTPVFTFRPYLGDYAHLMAVGKDFYGIFSANNTPDLANFPNGVLYNRNANFTTNTLLDVDNATPVNISIDPFFFKVTPDPCQSLVDAANALVDEIASIQEAIDSGEIPIPKKDLPKVEAYLHRLEIRLQGIRRSLQRCRVAHP
jgi:hypothetical protein